MPKGKKRKIFIEERPTSATREFIYFNDYRGRAKRRTLEPMKAPFRASPSPIVSLAASPGDDSLSSQADSLSTQADSLSSQADSLSSQVDSLRSQAHSLSFQSPPLSSQADPSQPAAKQNTSNGATSATASHSVSVSAPGFPRHHQLTTSTPLPPSRR